MIELRQSLRLDALIARDFQRDDPLHRPLPGQINRGERPFAQPQQHVKIRLAEAILGDGIPDTRDIMLVSLAEPCGLLSYVLSDAELENRRDRIRMLCNLETISRTVNEAIVELDKNIRIAMQKVV